MNLSENNLLFLLVGAFFTLIANAIVVWIRNSIDKKNKRQNYILLTTQELKTVRKNLDKLKTAFEYGHYFDFKILESLKKSIETLEEGREKSIYVNNTELQEKIIDLTTLLSNFSTSTSSVQQLYYDENRNLESDELNTSMIKKGKQKKQSIFATRKENNEIFQRNSTYKLIELVEINRKIEEVLEELEN